MTTIERLVRLMETAPDAAARKLADMQRRADEQFARIETRFNAARDQSHEGNRRMKTKLELRTLDGTLSIRRENDCFVVGIARDDRIKPLEFPPLRATSLAALRTLADDALEAEAMENAPCIA